MRKFFKYGYPCAAHSGQENAAPVLLRFPVHRLC